MAERERSRFAWLGLPAVWLIIAYQHSLGFVMGGRCRFTPSCSFYGLEAFRTLAPWTAFRLTAWRILRCHPWGGSGVDPVPPLGKMRRCCGDEDHAGAGDGDGPIR